MASNDVLSTAMAVAKALQVKPKPLTVNGVRYDGTEAVDVTAGQFPIVATEEEMTDTEAQYVLESTGTVWRYRYVQGHTNRLPLAYTSPTDHRPYNTVGDPVGSTVGYRLNYRVVSSTGVEEPKNGSCFLTGYIPVLPGSVLKCRHMRMNPDSYGCIAPVYDGNGEILLGKHLTLSNGITEDGTIDGLVITVPTSSSYETVRFIRIQGYYKEGVTPDLATAVVVVDEELSDGEGGHRWVDTAIPVSTPDSAALQALEARTAELEADGELDRRRITELERAGSDALPSWWTDYLPARIEAIRAHQDEGGRDAFSFAVISDLHESGNLGKRTGAVARAVMDGCGMRFGVDLGDASTRASVDTREDMESSMREAAAILAPIGEGLLRTQGNHDGAWGNDGGSYVHNFSERELYNRLFRSVACSQKPIFDADGVGYFVDDTPHRARFVVLNTHHTGSMRNYFSYHRLGQSQFDMLVKALTTVPDEDWCVLLFCHIPPVWGADYDEDGVEEVSLENGFPEQVLLRSLMGAYTARQEDFSGAYGSAGAWDAVRLSGIDFSHAKGKPVACFSGHLHGDAVYGVEKGYSFPVITVRCDAPSERFLSQQAEPRAAGTYTEHSFDAVTVVRTETGFTLYLDKIGAGADRVIRIEV